MVDEDEYVETSDLEELEMERQKLLDPTNSTLDDERPPKRIKLSHTSSSPDGFGLASPSSSLPTSRTTSSSTLLTVGSPVSVLYAQSRSQTRSQSPHQQSSLPKWIDQVSDGNLSQDPLLLQTQGQSDGLGTQVNNMDTINCAIYDHMAPDSDVSSAKLSPNSPRLRNSNSPSPAPLSFPASPVSEPRTPNHSHDANRFPSSSTKQLFGFSPLKSEFPGSLSPLIKKTTPEHSPGLAQGMKNSIITGEAFSAQGESSYRNRLDEIMPVPSGPPDAMSEEDRAAITNLTADDIARRKYSLRARTAIQRMPYSVENIQYKQQLQGNREAIVRMKELERHSHHNSSTLLSDERGQATLRRSHEDEDENHVPEREWRKRRRQEKQKARTSVHGLSPSPEHQQSPHTFYDDNLTGMQWVRAEEKDRAGRKGNKKARKSEPQAQVNEDRSLVTSDQMEDFLQDYFDEDTNSAGNAPHGAGPSNSAPSTPGRSPIKRREDIAMDIDSDDGEPSQSRKGSKPPILDEAQRTKLRILGKMIPASMMGEFIEGSASRTKRKKLIRHELNHSDDDGRPVLPGHVRKRRVYNASSIHDIKGDSESEREQSLSSTDESSSDVEALESSSSKRPRLSRSRVAELPPEPFEETDSDWEEDIQTVLRTRPRRSAPSDRIRDPPQVNYMLTRGSGSGQNKRKRDASESDAIRFNGNLHVRTSGAKAFGRGRQTSLDFSSHGTRRQRGHALDSSAPQTGIKSGGRPGSQPRYGTSSDGDVRTQDDQDDAAHRALNDRRAWIREQRKFRKARKVKNGTFTINRTGKRTRENTAFFTGDLEIEKLNAALLPGNGGAWLRHENIAHRTHRTCPKQNVSSTVQEDINGPEATIAEYVQSSTTASFGMDDLHSDQSFALATSIRKGHLQDLISVVSGEQDPIRPSGCTMKRCDVVLSPDMPVKEFCAALSRVCDVAIELSSGLPIPSSDSEEWGRIANVVPWMLSWYLWANSETDQSLLRQAVEKEVLRVPTHVQKPQDVCTTTISSSWFFLNLSFRLSVGHPVGGASNIPAYLDLCATSLIRLLLHYGLGPVTKLLKSKMSLDSTSVAHYAAEAWVNVIQIFGAPRDFNQPKSIFWRLVKRVVEDMMDAPEHKANPWQTSENIWQLIFALCALSRFSVHGILLRQSSLRGDWSLVVLALKKVALQETLQERESDHYALQERDRYVAFITTRCSILHTTWHWPLENASSMLNGLVEIFRSRNFANLRNQHSRPPLFFTRARWEELSNNPRDTTFGTLLYLISRAIQEEQARPSNRTSSKIKKLLGLAIPLGELTFAEDRDLTLRERSMYSNRISAISLAIHLDSTDFSERIQKAQSYVKFVNASHNVRILMLHCLYKFVLLLQPDIDLGPILSWVGDTAQHSQNQCDLALLVLTIARTILEAHGGNRYPDPALISCIEPILCGQLAKEDSGRLRDEIHDFIKMFFRARNRALPTPVRPIRVPPMIVATDEGEEESQDYFDNFPDVSEWAGHVDEFDNSGVKPHELELALKQFMEPRKEKFKWLIYRHLKDHISIPSPNADIEDCRERCKGWIFIWVCYWDVLAKPTDKWKAAIETPDSFCRHEKGNDDFHPWHHFVELNIMHQLLLRDPCAYLAYTDKIIRILFIALVSDQIEPFYDFVSCVLSIDCCQHPLLSEMPNLPPVDPTTGDYNIREEQFAEVRLLLLRGIFSSLDRALRQSNRVELYLEWCFETLSAMRSILLEVGQGGPYSDFCLKVMTAFQENPTLRSQDRFAFFSHWVRILTKAN